MMIETVDALASEESLREMMAQVLGVERVGRHTVIPQPVEVLHAEEVELLQLH
jgi:hypothetical protein